MGKPVLCQNVSRDFVLRLDPEGRVVHYCAGHEPIPFEFEPKVGDAFQTRFLDFHSHEPFQKFLSHLKSTPLTTDEVLVFIKPEHPTYPEVPFMIRGYFRASDELFELSGNCLETQNRLQKLLQHFEQTTRTGAWEYHLGSQESYWTQEVFKIHEMAASDGQPSIEDFSNFIDEEARPILKRALEHLKQSGTFFELELPVITAKKKKTWVRITGRAYRENEKIKKIYGTYQEILNERSLRLKVQDQQKKIFDEKERFESIVNHIPILISLSDLENRVLWVNQDFKNSLGYEAKDFESQSHLDPIRTFAKAIDQDWTELKIITADGHERELLWTEVQTKSGQKIGIGQDITLRKAQERTIEAQRVKIAASAKFSSLGEMAAGIAHEINNPLAIIQGKAFQIRRKMQDGKLDPETAVRDLEKIEQTCNRIVKIIKGLKTFSRNGESDPYSEATASVLMDDVLEFCKERFKNHSIDLRLLLPEDFKFECQVTQIGQVLLNLLNNAHDAVMSLENRWVEVKVTKALDHARFCITDSGSGIPKAVAEKMMLPFFTTKEVGKGTGLGLSISKGIIEDHGGVFYLNADHPNTQFIFEFPLKKTLTLKKDVA